jgi:SAM-dependent methyltransferase
MLNYDYAIYLAKQLVKDSHSCLLDYGCGAGQIVEKAITSGFEAFGVDKFYEGGNYREAALKTGLHGSRIFELKDGHIPFPDNKFDIVISNQVFEHIDDFATPLAEINRVMKQSGIFINILPSLESWHERHIGIPFVHWFHKGSKARLYYVLPLRMIGMGYHKGAKSAKQWTIDQLEWIDKWTFYKPIAQIKVNFEKYFDISLFDANYILFRLDKHPRLSSVAGLFEAKFFRPFLEFICARLASSVFVMKKK